MSISNKLLKVLLAGFLVQTQALAADEPEKDKKEEGFMESVKEEIHNVGTVTLIMAKYARDPLLGFFKLQVYADGEHVKIAGYVETDMQYQRAVMLALNTNGVKTVDASRVEIKKGEKPIQDLFITAVALSKIYGLALFDSEDPDVWSVKVETKDSIVYVTGDVDSKETKQKVLEALKSIKDVKDVKDDVRVKPKA